MTILRHIPLFKLLLPFILGIVFSSYFPTEMNEYWLISLVLIGVISIGNLILLNRLKHKPIYRRANILFLNIFFLTAGFISANLSIEKFHTSHFQYHLLPEKPAFVGTIQDELIEKEKSFKTEIDVTALDYGDSVVPVSGKMILYLQKEGASELQYGDQIVFWATPQEIDPPMNPQAFDYKRYLFHHQIYYQAYVSQKSWEILPQSEMSLMRLAYKCRSQLLGILREIGLEGDDFAVASALLLGKKDFLSGSLSRAYSSAGAMHVLAVSGLHVGIIYVILSQLFRFLPNKQKWKIIEVILVLIGVWAYALITGLSPSVIRSATMFSAIGFATAFRRTTNIYNTLAASAFFILLWKPFMIMQVGMQLSYLAVLGIVYIQPKIASLWEPKLWLMKKVWEISCVSVAAQIATAPLGLLYFHQFPNYFLVSNLFVIPMAFLLVYSGVLAFTFHTVPVLGWLLGQALLYLTKFLNYCVEWIVEMPYSITEGIDISTFETWLIYLIVGGVLIFIQQKTGKWIITTATLIIAFLSIQIWEDINQVQQNQITFYHTRGQAAFSWVKGLKVKMTGDEELLEDEDQMLFHVWHHLWHHGVDSIQDLNPVITSADSNYSIYVLENKVLLHLNKTPNSLPEIQNIDWLLISNRAYVPKEWLEKVTVDDCILDGTTSSYQAEKQFDWLTNHNQTVINTHQTGGFIRYFQP